MITARKGLLLSLFAMLFIGVVHAARAEADTSSAERARAGSIENSVLKVFSSVRYPDPYRPWTKQPPQDITGTGVVIEGDRILTNAHVVLYASQVQVQANQAGDKLSATVEAIAPDIDLAVLRLKDGSFFRQHPPLSRANALPEIKDAVWAYGYPMGGSSLSITKGIVSRIEFASYSSAVSGLRIQIDAAINPGNSGGPAVVNDKMIGLAFSKLGNADNIGYIIPNEEIDLFLNSIRYGQYGGKLSMFDSLQTLENDGLRAYLHLDPSVKGVVVHQPTKDSPDYPLKQWDVITRIGSTPIDDEGMISLDQKLRVSFRYAIQHVAKDDQVPLTVVRGGKTLQIQLPVSATQPMLISSLRGQYPSYFVYGPLVFSRATREFLAFMDRNPQLTSMLSYIKSPLVTQLGDPPTAQREELVVITSPAFPHPLSKGYSSMSGFVVKSVNGTPVRSLGHLVSLLRDLRDEFVVFEFDNRGGETQVYRRQDMVDATDDILNDNGVRAQGSPDMMQVWLGKAKP